MSIIKKHLLSEKLLWLVLFLFSILEIAIFMVTPFIYQFLIDDVIENKEIKFLFITVFLYFLSYVTLVYFGFLKEVFTTKLVQKAIQKTRNDYYIKLKKTKPTYLNKVKVGSEITVLMNEISDVIEQYVVGSKNVIVNILRIIFACIILSFLNFKLLIILIICLPLYILLTNIFKNKIGQNAKQFNEIREGYTNVVHDGIEGYEDILIYKRHGWDFNLVNSESIKFIKNRVNNTKLLRAATDISYLFYWGVICAIYYFSALKIINGDFTVGLMLVYVAYLDNLYSPSRIILSSLATLKNAKSLSSNLNKKIETMIEHEEDLPDDSMYNNEFNELSLNGIKFQYNEESYPFFIEQIKLKSGDKIGFVGESGGGKTTLLKIISGLYKPSIGTIEVDHLPINCSYLRECSIICTQNPHLFSMGLDENIHFSNTISNDKEFIKFVYDELGLHDFINKNPIELSGGQYHRIALARTLISEAKLYIFDEPTASIDLEKRNSFYKILDHLIKKGKIIIVSTHNVKELSDFDKVYTVHQGIIEEK